METLRTFDHFPESSICPVCGTNEDATTILVNIDGTEDGSIVEAAPAHLNCAVATNLSKSAEVLYVPIFVPGV